jgi:hypothetical protein
MNDSQKLAIKCAFADLCGAMQAYEQQDQDVHDWNAHMQSILDLIEVFPEFDFTLPKNLEGVE